MTVTATATGTAMARVLVSVPSRARAGEIIEIRATIAHPMETGQRSDASGRIVPRDIVSRVVCRQDGEIVLSATLHPAITPNPFVSFCLLATASGPLQISWEGDNGFSHTETVMLNVC